MEQTEVLTTKKKLDILKDIAYEIIEEQELPTPKEIKFKQPFNGTLKTTGMCYKNKLKDTYRISITITQAKFVEDPNGIYTNDYGKSYSRIMGEERPIKDIIKTIAHEIAHIKYYQHDKTHKEYQEYILNMIYIKLNVRGLEFD